MNLLEWVHSWMNPLPLWSQIIIGIGSLAIIIIVLIVFPKFIDWIIKEFKKLKSDEY